MTQEFSENISAKLPAIKTAMRAGARQGLFAAAHYVLGESNDQVPIERGMRGGLMSTGQATVDGENLRAAVSYDADHAVAQHENMSYNHDAGRRAKYLELAMSDNSDAVAQLIQRAILKETG